VNRMLNGWIRCEADDRSWKISKAGSGWATI
jgi:hypothetical protein